MEKPPTPAPTTTTNEARVDAGESLAAGRYLVYGRLGQGAQGETLRAIDKQLGREVAVKRFRVGHATRWKDVELAEREARILASLSHPALPQYFDYFEENGCLYLVMECVDGESLASHSKQGKRLGLTELRLLLGTLSNVLDYLHSRVPPVIHRDIKPGNIIRRPDGSFCLVDFGSVRDGLRPDGGSTVVGTFGYMAPEQFQGRAMPSTDLYAVGALLLALLTGKPPEELPHQGLRLDAHAALAGALPPRWVELIAQLVDIDPDKRPSSLAPLLETLDQGQHVGGSQSVPRNDAEPHVAQEPESRDGDAAFTIMVGSGLAIIPLLALTIARIAILFALGVAVPIVLYLLSLFFGARLREVAGQVVQAGHHARARLAELSGHLQRAEPFVLQGRHYGRQRRRNRARRSGSHDWHDNARDTWSESDRRRYVRFDDSPADDDNDAERRPTRTRDTRRGR